MRDGHNVRHFSIYMIVLVLLSASPFSAHAAKYRKKIRDPNPDFGYTQAAIVVNGETGRILHEKNARKPLHPASLVKLMTIYLTFEALDEGKLTMSQMLKVSRHAASRPRRNLGLKKDEYISVKDAILAVIIRSANDAAVVLAEAVSGSEKEFAQKMTARARSLGMTDTTFQNASGLTHRRQKTTAYDLAKLAIATRRDFAHYYSLFSLTSFRFRGSTIEGHNRIVKDYPGADGLKTGFVSASGHNIITTAARGNHRLVTVWIGGNTAKERDMKVTSLMDHYFSYLKDYNLISKPKGRQHFASSDGKSEGNG